MLLLDFNVFNINELQGNCDLEKNIISFYNDWASTSKTMIVKTSGSTGNPKLIEVEKKSMRNSANKTLDFLGIKTGSTALLALPLEYISGKMMMVRAIERNLKLQIVTPSLRPLKDLKNKINFCALTPLQVENSLDKIHLIQNLIIGGAKISINLIEKIHLQLGKKSDCKIYETFGMTETLSHIALKQIYPTVHDYFEILNGVEISVDDRNCLNIFAPEINNNTIQTNDIVQLIDNNRFQFLGRTDFVINTGGIKIFPEKIEDFIKKTISNEVVVIGLPNELLGNKVVAVIEAESITIQEKQLITNSINDIEFEHKFQKPKEIIFISKIPRTENGKIDRNSLIKLLQE
ncbi:MAG: AMP-binding protein [Bacteroidetes bacterium]|nr:AMP-binding protein [Bacteroidota bacterium]